MRQRCALVQPSQTGRGSPQNPPGSQKFWPPAGAGGGERAPSPGPPDAPQAGQGRDGGTGPARLQSSQALSVLDPQPPPTPSSESN